MIWFILWCFIGLIINCVGWGAKYGKVNIGDFGISLLCSWLWPITGLPMICDVSDIVIWRRKP